MIIDIHAHLWADPAAQRARAAVAGVDTTVLLSTRFHPESAVALDGLRREFARLLSGLDGGANGQSDPADSYVRSTAELIAALDAAPAGAVGFATGPTADSAGARELIENQLLNPSIVGIGEITPAGGHGADLEPFLQIASDHAGLPVLAHGFAPNTVQDIRTYADLAARYPRVPLIVGAFGGMSAMTLVELAAQRPNLYLDLSSALQVFMVRAAAATVPEQCLFGANSPYGDPLASRSTVEASPPPRPAVSSRPPRAGPPSPTRPATGPAPHGPRPAHLGTGRDRPTSARAATGRGAAAPACAPGSALTRSS